MVRTNLSTIKTSTCRFCHFKDTSNKQILQKQRKINSLAFILANCTMKPLFFKSQETTHIGKGLKKLQCNIQF